MLLDINRVPLFLDLSNGEIAPAPLPAKTELSRFVLAPDGRTILSYGSIESDGLVTPSLSLWDLSTWQEAPIASYAMHNPWGVGGDPIFSRDQTRLVQVQSYGVGFVVWGSRSPEQADALMALQDYLGLLVDGEYAQAASMLVVEELPAWNTMVLDQQSVIALVPEVDPADAAALLEVCVPIGLSLCAAA